MQACLKSWNRRPWKGERALQILAAHLSFRQVSAGCWTWLQVGQLTARVALRHAVRQEVIGREASMWPEFGFWESIRASSQAGKTNLGLRLWESTGPPHHCRVGHAIQRDNSSAAPLGFRAPHG